MAPLVGPGYMLSSPVDESYGTNTGASSDQPQSPAKKSVIGAFGPAGAHNLSRGKYENLNLREQSYHASDLLHRVFGKLSSLATSPMTVPAASSSGGGRLSAQAVRAVVLLCGIFVMLFVMDKMYRQVVDDSVHEFDAEIEDELAHDRAVKNIVSQNGPLALGRGGTTAATMVRVQDGNSRAGTTAAAPDASVTAQLPLLTATTSEDRGVNDVAERGEDVKKPLKLMIAIPTHNRVGYVRFLADVRKQFLLKDMPKESLYVFDDGSSEYTPEDLKEWFDLSASHVYRHGSSMGPEICMHQIVRKFLQKPQFDALLVLDSDLVPAVNFRHAVESILPALGVTGGMTSAFANSHRTLLTLFNPSHFYAEHRKIGEFSVAESLRSLSEAAKTGDEQATDASEKSLATLSEAGVARQQKQARHIDATFPLEEKESAGTGGLLITWGVAHDLMYGSFDLDKKLHNWRRPRAAYKFDEQLIKFVHGHNPGMNTVGAAAGGAGGSSSADGGSDAAGAAAVNSSNSRRWKFVAPKHSLLMHIGMFGRYHHDDVANPNNLGGIEGQVVSGPRPPGQTNLLTHHLGTSHGGMDTQQFPLWKQPAFVRGGIKWFYTQKHSPTHLYKHDGETDN